MEFGAIALIEDLPAPPHEVTLLTDHARMRVGACQTEPIVACAIGDLYPPLHRKPGTWSENTESALLRMSNSVE
jgi:hypothetical protein